MVTHPFILSALALALLLPAMYRRHARRQSSDTFVPQKARRGRLAVAGLSALLVIGAVGSASFATDGDANGAATSIGSEQVVPKGTPDAEVVPMLTAAIAKDRTSINMTWLIVGGILVLFMQAGFALVETGFTRAKNAAHTMMMNLVIFALGVVGWFICGYALMFEIGRAHV